MKVRMLGVLGVIILATSSFAFEAPRAVVLSNQAVPDGRAAPSTSERSLYDEEVNMRGGDDGTNGRIRAYRCNRCSCRVNLDEGQRNFAARFQTTVCTECGHRIAYHVVSNRKVERECEDESSDDASDEETSDDEGNGGDAFGSIVKKYWWVALALLVVILVVK